MIGGEEAGRILREVLRGVLQSATDTQEQREYRESVVRSVEETKRQGGVVEMPDEF